VPAVVSAAVGAARTSVTGGSEADTDVDGSDAVVDKVPLVEVAASVDPSVAEPVAAEAVGAAVGTMP
jgi:hypothetical protein